MDRDQIRKYLKLFDFAGLFTQALGWDHYSASITQQVENHIYQFKSVAEKHGVVILVMNSIPEYAIRVKLDKLIAKQHFEHLIIFADQAHGRQVWQWFRKETGKPVAVRTYHFSAGQTNELLLQKLENLIFTLAEEDNLSLGDVTARLRTLDVEKVTKKFYERFKVEHSGFLTFIQGIPDRQMESWYASVMVNRLMFLYFIQEKGFLNGDRDYLRNQLKASRDRKPDAYYKDFLCLLFFQGFARKKVERSAAVNQLLGEIPYLNGGLFQPHQIEELHGKHIVIADKAFEKLFNFFKEYDWHLDERENRNDREINPDVLGYIFEKYVNQKQMGAYYTKEDITEYIAQNTIIPFLLDEARKGCAVAFASEGSVWRLLRDDPDRYIHDAMKKGADIELPPEIEAGVADVSRRGGWNRPAPESFALPTEIWREAVDRHQRYRAVKAKLEAGEVHQVNDLVTLNLNIRQFIQDVIQFSEGPELLRALWKAIGKVSVLDPTCGSGAFLFAALNMLKPLYEACLIRMQGFIEDMEAAGTHRATKFEDFKKTLAESARHPKQDYFILKAIIVNNLFGVDIMEEAVEICKLRLFLKLVAQVESQDRIEPLPDIDFNIRAGNTLVGYARYEDVQKAVTSKFDFGDAMGRIEDKAKILDAAVEVFRKQQTELDGTVTSVDKAELRKRFAELEVELNDYLYGEYDVKKTTIKAWQASHKPFHWFCDYHRIMQNGGFDIVIGNPPYIELNELNDYTLKGYQCLKAGNLYAIIIERCISVSSLYSRHGFIVPVSSISTDRYESLQYILNNREYHLYSSFDDRPSRLFDGLEHIRLTIHIFTKSQNTIDQHLSTRYNKWSNDYRPTLFSTLSIHNSYTSLIHNSLPKLSSSHEISILDKLKDQRSTLEYYLRKNGHHKIYYSRKVGYFLQVLDFEPRVIDRHGKKRPPSEFKELYFDSQIEANIALCILNSNLFYWFITVFSDCRHINKREIEAFPIQMHKNSFNKFGEKMNRLANKLMDDIKVNSEIRTMQFSHDILKVQCIIPKYSKTIINKIDDAIAEYYHFTVEELDYITNYDVKFRMGIDIDKAQL